MVGYAFRKHCFFKMYISSRLKDEDVYIKSLVSKVAFISPKGKQGIKDSMTNLPDE